MPWTWIRCHVRKQQIALSCNFFKVSQRTLPYSAGWIAIVFSCQIGKKIVHIMFQQRKANKQSDFVYKMQHLYTNIYLSQLDFATQNELYIKMALPFVLRRQMMTMRTIIRLSKMTAQMTPMMITSVSVRSVFEACPKKTQQSHTWVIVFNQEEKTQWIQQ